MEALGEAVDEAVTADEGAARFLFIIEGGNESGGGYRGVAVVVAIARRLGVTMGAEDKMLRYIDVVFRRRRQVRSCETYRDGR